MTITSDPSILNGEPIIDGTRTPVRAVIESRRLGMTNDEILHGMPHLTLTQITAALGYYEANQAQITLSQ